MREKRRQLRIEVNDTACERTGDISKDERPDALHRSAFARLVLQHFRTELDGAIRAAFMELEGFELPPRVLLHLQPSPPQGSTQPTTVVLDLKGARSVPDLTADRRLAARTNRTTPGR